MSNFKRGRKPGMQTLVNRTILSMTGEGSNPVVQKAVLAAGILLLASHQTMQERLNGETVEENGQGFAKRTEKDGMAMARWTLGVKHDGTPKLNKDGSAVGPQPFSDSWVARAREVVEFHIKQIARSEYEKVGEGTDATFRFVGEFTKALTKVERIHNVPGVVQAYQAALAHAVSLTAPAAEQRAQEPKAAKPVVKPLAAVGGSPESHALVRRVFSLDGFELPAPVVLGSTEAVKAFVESISAQPEQPAQKPVARVWTSCS
jgi:hypothetical protein